MKLPNRARQAGFTLVEIAIVLVIIGVLLVGVLQGQEMIENSKTKAIVNTMKGVQAAYNGYIDRFQTIPGDDALATMTARGWTQPTVGGNANGVLAAAVGQTFANNAGETQAFWQALRASGFLSGAANGVGPGALPRHGANGLIGVAVGAGAAGTVYGMPGMVVCASGLSTKQAAAVDVIVDGPLPAATNIGNNVGNLRAATGAGNPLAPVAAAPAPLAYNETTTGTNWTVCMKIA
jgi:prepilin-type N-terminal cleavage/methylation domain-containing protein